MVENSMIKTLGLLAPALLILSLLNFSALIQGDLGGGTGPGDNPDGGGDGGGDSGDAEAPPPIENLEMTFSADDSDVYLLTWDVTPVDDFAEYRVFITNSRPTDVTGLTPVAVIMNKATNYTSISRDEIWMDDATDYHSAVVAVDTDGDVNNDTGSSFAGPETYYDAHAPGAVANLDMTVGQAPDRFILSWDEFEDPDFSAYQIYFSLEFIADVTELDTHEELLDSDSTQIEITENEFPLEYGTNYYAAVVVVDTASNINNNTTETQIGPVTYYDGTPPDLISGLQLSFTTEPEDALHLQWNPSDAEDFAAYEIYLSSSSLTDIEGTDPVVSLNTVTETELVFTREMWPSLIFHGESYYAAVTTVDAYDNVNTATDQVQAGPITWFDTTPLADLTGVEASFADVNGGQIDLTWDISTADDFQRYMIYVSDSEPTMINAMVLVTTSMNAQLDATTLGTTDYSFVVDSSYWVAVVGQDTAGNYNPVVSVNLAGPVIWAPTTEEDLPIDDPPTSEDRTVLADLIEQARNNVLLSSALGILMGILLLMMVRRKLRGVEDAENDEYEREDGEWSQYSESSDYQGREDSYYTENR